MIPTPRHQGRVARHPALSAAPPLPMNRAEMEARGWQEADIVFVSGDAYVDHPSFAMAILARVLENAGFRIGLLCQPDWRSAAPWRTFGKPRLCFAISAGNMDSMINHYTANRKVRNDDAYSPGGRIGLRPDRATLAYCQRARQAYPGVPVIAGGVEASLRRLAHYDYWSDTVRGSIVLDAKADLVVYGMGERNIVTIAQRLAAGHSLQELRDLRGVTYALGASEAPPTGPHVVCLPSLEAVRTDKRAFSEATRMIHHETNPLNARALVQWHGNRAVVQSPPDLPLTQAEMDAIYDLPFTRKPHPSYRDKIPAYEIVKDSVTIMRGCFGGCTFCSITTHQGRTIQSRSPASVLRELQRMHDDPAFKGVVSDLGGPTANMYAMRCTKPEVEAICRRLSCVHPKICVLLGTDHTPLIELMRQAREVPGIRQVLVASGIRMDLARRSPTYMDELAAHHVGGHLKVAPEHVNARVLEKMKKPANVDFEGFTAEFQRASRQAGKPKQSVVPYFIASHPGSDLAAMIELALFLKRHGYRPDQVQDFIPAPMDIATSMYYTGLDPRTLEPVVVATRLRERRFQRALLQFFKPENYFTVRQALIAAGRSDLIGDGADALIPSRPPPQALEARRQRANHEIQDAAYVHQIPGEPQGQVSSTGQGYRPHRAGAGRRERRGARPAQAPATSAQPERNPGDRPAEVRYRSPDGSAGAKSRRISSRAKVGKEP
ncbi:MAG: YgiQ family radical SAM protein [Candidatus Tectimicrobiota bacterium]